MKRDSFMDLLDKKIGKQSPTFLPDSCFVSFSAKKLKNPKMVWLNYDLLSDLGIPTASNADLAFITTYIIDTYAFMIPSEERDESSFFKDESAVFYGDRYGDHGEVCNGGSVRCGIRGNFQVKGIGRNQLANKNMDYWHTHGGATIEEGLREAIWGEILNKELPHGASRILAIIATGKTTPYDFGLLKKEDDVEPLGGLIIRECNVRPAHFMRATFFSPFDKFLNDLQPDHIRTRDAALKLPEILAEQIGVSSSTFNDGNIAKLIGTTFERLAEQVATSKAKRIAHGALTPGNMEISGRYIDFGTTTALCDFSNPIISRGMPPIWNEFEQVLSNSLDFSFYINKYIGDDSEIKSRSIYGIVSDAARYQYFSRLQLEILKLTGIPEKWLNEYPDVKNCSEAFVEALRQNGAVGIPLANVPDSLGAVNPLNFFEGLLASYDTVETNNAKSYVQLKFDNLISWSLGVALYEDISRENYFRFLSYRIRQFNKNKSCIYRDKVQAIISNILPSIQKTNDIDRMMWETIDEAVTQSPFQSEEIALVGEKKFHNRSVSIYRVFNMKLGYGFIVSITKTALNFFAVDSMMLDTLKGELLEFDNSWQGHFYVDSLDFRTVCITTTSGETIELDGAICQI